MAKFTRGGERQMHCNKNSDPIQQKNVAFCGYHGWHDWYLSANLDQKKFRSTFNAWIEL